MFAIAAAVIMFLLSFGAINSTNDVNWTLFAVALFFLHFGWDFGVAAVRKRQKQE